VVKAVAVLGAVAVGVTLVVACGGATKQATTAAPVAAETSSAGSPMPGDPRAEIEHLWAVIEQQRTDLGLAAPSSPLAPGPATPMASTPLSSDDTCKPAKTDRCTQSCTFSDSICKNAARICEIAEQLVADTWAAEKCTRAKQTCDTAHESCCGCQ
jgi:hypothetical protein